MSVRTTTSTTTATSTVTTTPTTTYTTTVATSSATSTSSTTSECPPLVGCGPYPTLLIDGAMAQIESQGPTHCWMTNVTAVCAVFLSGGDSGRVMVNVTFQVFQPGTYGGGADVAFLVYSSAAHYVNFTSLPTCAYTSGPSLEARGCNVPTNEQVGFQFVFSVSPGYNPSGQQWPDSVTVSMWQTCCFP